MSWIVTGGAALVLALIHVRADAIAARLPHGHRRRALSFAAGVSVGYVFVHLLPEVEEAGPVLAEAARGGPWAWMRVHAWVMALFGFLFFYGLERMVRGRGANNAGAPRGVFWLHLAGFALYNGIIGYVLAQGVAASATGVALFTAAMALHFLVTDHALWEDHHRTYRRRGRWMLAAAVLVGWGLGRVEAVREVVVVGLTAFLAGGILLNVLKEELPEERDARWWAFSLGALAYGALLLAL